MLLPRILRNIHPELLLCLLMAAVVLNTLSYSLTGFEREIFNNGVYLKHIETFPRDLTPRLEPFFVTLAWLLQRLTNLSPVVILILLKNITLALHVGFFYGVAWLLTRLRKLSFFLTGLYWLSFPFFTIYDNLLRNFLGNAFLLILIYCYLRLLIEPKKLTMGFASLLGVVMGLLWYTHLLPTLLFLAGLGLFTIVRLLRHIFARYRFWHIPSHVLLGVRYAVLLTGLGLIIALPFLLTLLNSYLSLADYQGALTTPAPTAGPPFVSSPSPTPSMPITSIAPVARPEVSAPLFPDLLYWWRFFFEYRDVGFPYLLAPLLLLAIPYLAIAHRYRPSTAFILCLWFVAYLGTKADFGGLAVLPFRFSLMLSILSLCILALLLREFWSITSSRRLRYFLIIGLAASFLAQNLPPLLETTILRDYQARRTEVQNLQEWIASHRELSEGLRIFLDREVDPKILYTTDPLEAYELARKMDIHYIPVDDSHLPYGSSDLGVRHTTSLNKFFNRKYFVLAARIDNPFSHLYLFKVNDQAGRADTVDFGREIVRLEVEDLAQVNRYLRQVLLKDSIEEWEIVAEVTPVELRLTERVRTPGTEYILYHRPSTIRLKNRGMGFPYQQVVVTIPDIPLRRRQAEVPLIITLHDAVLALRSSQTVTLTELTEPHFNLLRLRLPYRREPITIFYLTRLQYKIWIHRSLLIIGVLASLLFFSRTMPPEMSARRITWAVGGFLALVVINLTLGVYLLELYKSWL